MIRLLLALLLFANIAHAKPQIVVSITPVASLFSMIARGRVDVSVIASGSGCPHHYSLKPSDITLAQKADLLVYIDDKFDAFATVFARKSHAKVLKIVDLKDLYIENGNLHLWLLPSNAEAILRSATYALTELSLKDKGFFEQNLVESLKQIRALEKRRVALFASMNNAVLLTDSAEYLFSGSNSRKLYMHDEYSSIKQSEKIREISRDSSKCFIISASQNEGRYRALLGQSAHLVQLNSENWRVNGSLAWLYYEQYGLMLDEIKRECGG